MAIRESEYGVRSVIETTRLRLEPWSDAHFDRFSQFMRDPAVIRYIRAEPLDRDRAHEQHERSLEEWETFGFGKRALIEAETNAWLGFVELSQVGPGKGSRDDDVELGYFVEPTRWGEGIATEAAVAARDEAFERCGINELIGRCRVENVASARVLAKVGFRPLRLHSLADDIIVEIHRIERADWAGAERRPRSVDALDAPGEGDSVRRGNATVVADRSGDERTTYDVVLLAGSPRRSTLALDPDLTEGSTIEVDGEQWTIADVRMIENGPPQLICIYAV